MPSKQALFQWLGDIGEGRLDVFGSAKGILASVQVLTGEYADGAGNGGIMILKSSAKVGPGRILNSC